nr:MAG TPA: hypothetical protein [Caudoviricetes sp.]
MTTFDDLKQKYLDHLASMDLAALSVAELATYGCILLNVSSMCQRDVTEQMTSMLPLMFLGKKEAGGDG